MERFCHRYKKLPHEILEMDMEWIETFLDIWEFDQEKSNKDAFNRKVQLELKRRTNG